MAKARWNNTGKVIKGVTNDANRSDWTAPHNARPEIGGAFDVDRESVQALVSELEEVLVATEAEMRQVIGAALVTNVVSWADIGAALGITRQGASQRFRGARRYMSDHAGPEERTEALRAVGAKHRPIMYELFDGGESTGLRRRDPSKLLRTAAKLADPMIAKQYPDGTVKYPDVEAVEEWHAVRTRKAAKRAAKSAAHNDENDEAF